MSKVYFDHTYTIDNNFQLIKRMESFGFKLSEKVVEHPSSRSRFIYLNNCKYLEFIQFTTPVKNWWNLSGISFGVNEGLKKYSNTPRIRSLKAEYSHRNYNWIENNLDYLPGWNFLGFKKVGFRTFHPWFTEYEKGRREIPNTVRHPNGVNDFHGNLFGINLKGRDFFERILKRKIKDKIQLSDGTWLYFKNASTNKHEAVILQSMKKNSLETFKDNSKLIKTHGLELYLFDYPNRHKNCWKIGVVG